MSAPRWTVVRMLALGLLLCLILGAVLLGSLGPWDTADGKQAARIRSDLANLERAVRQFAAVERRLPTGLEELRPRFISEIPKDPWGRTYVLRSGGPERIYLWCLGADGALKRYPPDVCAIVDLQ